jgi:hypothetical protein
VATVKPALATAEAERIHRLVRKLNTVISRAAACGLKTSLTVTSESFDTEARLDVYTTLGFGSPAEMESR